MVSVNPNRRTHLERLRNARRHSYRELEPYRRSRNELVRQYVGAHYGGGGTQRVVPLNLIELAVSIYSRHLIARSPRVLVRSRSKSLRAEAATIEIVVNEMIEKQNLTDTLRVAVVDALFSIGLIKLGLKSERDDAMVGAGSAWAECVDIDDWVHDVTARRYGEVQFEGNRYRMPLEFARTSELFNRKARDRLQAADSDVLDSEGGERVAAISREGDNADAHYREMVDLWDIWLPQEKLLITMCDPEGTNILRTVEWSGPSHGPYHRLGFNWVPGNLMPLAPLSAIRDLHELANALFRKLKNQAERQKTVVAARAEATEDAERVIRVEDGEVFRSDNPEGIREIRFGGVDRQNLAFTIMTKDLFAYFGGNLDVLGGLGAQSETLGQDEILVANASKRIAHMGDAVVKFTRQIVTDLAWYRWTDPVRVDQVTKRVPGEIGLGVGSTLAPVNRLGKFFDYEFSVEPYSMQHQSPAARLQTITRIFSSFIAPLLPLMQAQGVGVDFNALMRHVAKYSDMDELNEIITFNQPSAGEVAQMRAGQSPVSHHTSERVNRPGRTNQGADYALAQTLLGGGVQGSEAAAALRPGG